jgi:hypothetical protein
MITSAPFGSWKSHITPDAAAGGAARINGLACDGEDVYWIEQRPEEGGRNVIVRRSGDGEIADVNPAPFNARTRVHEYGGGAFAVADGVVYFVNYADQRIYRQERQGTPSPITPEGKMRYADAAIDRERNRLICVREDHTASDHEPTNTLVSVKLDGSEEPQVIVSGYDFYSSPRLSPDGKQLAWITWNHPNMPWDGTELWLGTVNDDGTLGRIERVAKNGI